MKRLLALGLLLFASRAEAQMQDSIRVGPLPRATPQDDPAGWIGRGDYPPNAAPKRATVAYRLFVDINGLPRRCVLTRPAAYLAFNDLTCRLLTRRARFRAPRDKKNQSVESEYTGQVTWQP